MRIKEGYILRRVGGVGIVVSVLEKNRDQMVTLNHSGIELWKMMQEETDVPSLVQKMMEKYDVPEQVLEKDIVSFLRKIRKVGLLEE